MCYTLCRRFRENAVATREAKAFETVGKQGCACVAWSRKRRSVFISRQGVYESPDPHSTLRIVDKVCPEVMATLPEK